MDEISYEDLLKRYTFVCKRNKELEEKIIELKQQIEFRRNSK